MSIENSAPAVADAEMVLASLFEPGVECRELTRDELRRALSQRIASITPATRNVLDLMSQGHSNKIIAGELSITESTVKAHISIIMKALGCTNRTQAVLLALYSSRELCAKVEQQIEKIAFRRRV